MKNKVSIISTGGKNFFIELVNAIKESMEEICECNVHWIGARSHFPTSVLSDINIIIHGKALSFDNLLNSNSYNIFIQTEQPSIDNYYLYDLVLNFFDDKDGSTYFPLGYSKYFDCFEEFEEDIDLFFFGGLGKNKRRREIIKRYKIKYLKIFGKERDKIIKRSKFNVNILDNKLWKYTPLRAILIYSKGKIMFQEKTNGYGFHKPYIIEYDKDNLLEVIEEWKDYKKRKEYGMYIRESLMKTPFKEIFLNEILKANIL